MQFFLDTADIKLINHFKSLKLISGVTTNPAIMAKETGSLKKRVIEICNIVNGPVSVEVIATDANGMLEQALKLSAIHENIVVKLPANRAGFETLGRLEDHNVPVNMTVVYTSMQALLCAKLGARYVSPFVGRLDVNSTDGVGLLSEIRRIFDNYNFNTKILAASMRNAIYVKSAALAGADVATIPPDILSQLMDSELGDVSLTGFLNEWSNITSPIDLFED